MKYQLYDWDAVIVRIDGEGAHGFRGYDHWCLMGSCNGKYGNVTPHRIFEKGVTGEVKLDLDRHDALGKDFTFGEICTFMLELNIHQIGGSNFI